MHEAGDPNHLTRPRLPRRSGREIQTGWMTERMRRRLGPTQVMVDAVRDGVVPADRQIQSDRVVRAYDNLISLGFITRSDVYFSVPSETRRYVEDVANSAGQYWAPGRRGGLHRLIREQRTPFPHFETE